MPPKHAMEFKAVKLPSDRVIRVNRGRTKESCTKAD